MQNMDNLLKADIGVCFKINFLLNPTLFMQINIDYFMIYYVKKNETFYKKLWKYAQYLKETIYKFILHSIKMNFNFKLFFVILLGKDVFSYDCNKYVLTKKVFNALKQRLTNYE